jgi:hypothetical protein
LIEQGETAPYRVIQKLVELLNLFHSLKDRTKISPSWRSCQQFGRIKISLMRYRWMSPLRMDVVILSAAS